jgi:hypothetical protein
MAKSTEYPHNKKQAAAQVAKLKAAAAKKASSTATKKAKPKAKAKPKVKNLPGKKRTGPNIVKNLPAKKGAKKTYKPY